MVAERCEGDSGFRGVVGMRYGDASVGNEEYALDGWAKDLPDGARGMEQVHAGGVARAREEEQSSGHLERDRCRYGGQATSIYREREWRSTIHRWGKRLRMRSRMEPG